MSPYVDSRQDRTIQQYLEESCFKRDYEESKQHQLFPEAKKTFLRILMSTIIEAVQLKTKQRQFEELEEESIKRDHYKRLQQKHRRLLCRKRKLQIKKSVPRQDFYGSRKRNFNSGTGPMYLSVQIVDPLINDPPTIIDG
ncbi:hypothetical protein KQX54_013023 [Cotesia glomerata]|uniref:Uncharacterized protein n=1 Tax=Cotesia glomerata TaxID=32391 RepID=A0AAV7J1P6_COTGL|nr:hypothetical protein KQX54_013023 [Cotesia glomerata]